MPGLLRRIGSSVAALAAIGMVLLPLLGSGAVAGAATPAIASVGTTAHLVVATFPGSGAPQGYLRPLDPLTLADAAAMPVAGKATPAVLPGTANADFVYRELALSADGARAVTIVWPRRSPMHREVTARRGLSGPVIAQFSVPGQLGAAIPFGEPGTTFLSADGRRLLLAAEDHTGTPVAGTAARWTVYDTASGKLLTSFRTPSAGTGLPAAHFIGLSAMDPSGQRLYRLVPANPAAPGPQAVRLVATDLTTGKEVGDLDLPSVRAGAGNANDFPPLVSADVSLWPALAISPDGRELAVVSGDGSEIVLVDTARLAVARKLTLATPLAGTPAASPTPGASALTVLTATYAADGTHLFVTGLAHGPVTGTPIAPPPVRAIAVARIDLATGRIIAHAPIGSAQVFPSADGRSLYAATQRFEDVPGGPSLTFVRLDATTLAPLANRTIAGRTYAVLWPRVPNSQTVTIWF